MTVRLVLPEHYHLVEVNNGMLLAQKAGMWAVWRIDDDGDLVDGHFFCRTCPGAEALARADLAERAKRR